MNIATCLHNFRINRIETSKWIIEAELTSAEWSVKVWLKRNTAHKVEIGQIKLDTVLAERPFGALFSQAVYIFDLDELETVFYPFACFYKKD
jgi:hypothetical protein